MKKLSTVKPKLSTLFKKCESSIDAIYRIKVQKPKEIEKIVWKITSDRFTPEQHFSDKEMTKQRFASEKFYDALEAFYKYLKKRKMI